ncbi:MAG: adenine phosphoribosyltransferase [Bacilli bacterium]|jgi:adenine phosphoribosyltransferase|nr:adenine phosphoribosyltransferase [Bacilli bacterium]MDD2681778.1 adenine phosphoribosyltransferase [Bacilli bacterium]MDD3121608.1 adenine phosphoribosyltransferase [Bacilli bacterium]MDD4062967.1 adenine phosphoribosyltransferase [Bacilli bacterium]MDD4482325.1 adenine phosphoribosyltransferase [Bacilli bacterium]
MDYKKYIASVKDFPIEGILFRDITPLMADKDAFRASCEELSNYGRKLKADVVVGPESRGFIFGCPIAFDLQIGFIPIRKPDKLPRENISISYDLEYGHNTLCIHSDSIKKGQRVLIIDDLLATGGTIKATIELVEKLGGIVVGLGFLIELCDLKGRDLLKGYDIKSLVKY